MDPVANGDRKWRVGYWLTQKKMKKISFDQFLANCRAENLEMFELNFDNLKNQLPIDAVVHKLSDFIVQSEQGDLAAKEIVQKTEELEQSHPEILMFDPIGAVRILCNRIDQYSLLDFICSESRVKSPPFVKLQSNAVDQMLNELNNNAIAFPFISKPIEAHGSENAHRMQLVFGAHGLADIEMPCVAQQFIAHDGILYKVFVVGDDLFYCTRPSLKNFFEGDFPTLCFEKISKQGSESHLSSRNMDSSNDDLALIMGADPKQFVKAIRNATGLSLFGVDLIVEKESKTIYCIDVNTFPSYDSVSNFTELLCNFLVKSLNERNGAKETKKPVPNMVDSGLGSSAESDCSDCEKKLKEFLRQKSTSSGQLAIAYEPNRERLKKYYGIPKIFNPQLCVSGWLKNGKAKLRGSDEKC